MFRRDTYVLTAAALVGIAFVMLLVIGSTPFFPTRLETQEGECPEMQFWPAERGPVQYDSEAEWFSSALFALHEDPIFEQSDDENLVVRFVLLRSFHAPLVIRTTESPDGEIILAAKWAAGQDGCGSGTAGCAVNRPLTVEERERLAEAQAPVLRNQSYGCRSGIDGAMWIMEASGRGDYRYWSQWSPQRGDMHRLAVFLISLTGWRLTDLY